MNGGGMVICERYDAKLDIPTCLARQLSVRLGQGCSGCEIGTKLMEENGGREKMLAEREAKMIGICDVCHENRKLNYNIKDRKICHRCYTLELKKKHDSGEIKARKRRSISTGESVADDEKKQDRFTIDFSRRLRLLERLEAKANYEIRTIEEQILWELSKAITLPPDMPEVKS